MRTLNLRRLTAVGAALTLIDVIVGSVSDGTSEPIAGAVAAITGPLLGITSEQVHGFMLAIAPICALIVAQQLREIAVLRLQGAVSA